MPLTDGVQTMFNATGLNEETNIKTKDNEDIKIEN